MATGSGDCTVKLWSVAQLKEPTTLSEHRGVVYSVAFSADGRYLASGSGTEPVGALILWSVEQQKDLTTLIGHSQGVRSVAFSADGKYLASGSADNTVKLWSVEQQKELITF